MYSASNHLPMFLTRVIYSSIFVRDNTSALIKGSVTHWNALISNATKHLGEITSWRSILTADLPKQRTGTRNQASNRLRTIEIHVFVTSDLQTDTFF